MLLLVLVLLEVLLFVAHRRQQCHRERLAVGHGAVRHPFYAPQRLELRLQPFDVAGGLAVVGAAGEM